MGCDVPFCDCIYRCISGPGYGDTLVHIYGFNLGSEEFQPVAKINGVPCVRTTLISDEELTCLSPAGFGKASSVTVELNGVTSEPNALWSYTKVKTEDLPYSLYLRFLPECAAGY